MKPIHRRHRFHTLERKCHVLRSQKNAATQIPSNSEYNVMVPTTLIYPPPDTSPELKLQLPADLAANASNVDQTTRTTVCDDVFAVMSLGCLVIGGAFVFYVLFGMS